jgi:hypothetical protein
MKEQLNKSTIPVAMNMIVFLFNFLLAGGLCIKDKCSKYPITLTFPLTVHPQFLVLLQKYEGYSQGRGGLCRG